MSDEKKRFEELTPDDAWVHEMLDLGLYTWRHAVGTIAVAALIGFYVWWKYSP